MAIARRGSARAATPASRGGRPSTATGRRPAPPAVARRSGGCGRSGAGRPGARRGSAARSGPADAGCSGSRPASCRRCRSAPRAASGRRPRANCGAGALRSARTARATPIRSPSRARARRSSVEVAGVCSSAALLGVVNPWVIEEGPSWLGLAGAFYRVRVTGLTSRGTVKSSRDTAVSGHGRVGVTSQLPMAEQEHALPPGAGGPPRARPAAPSWPPPASGLAASTVAAGFPSIVPSSVLGAASPSNRINVGAIGNGRISRGARPAGHLEARHRPAIVARLRPRPEARRGRQDADQRPVRQEDRQALRRRHDLRRLPRAPGQQGRRRRRHQHARPPARDRRHRRGPRRQGRLPAEAGLADDRRGPRGPRRRAPLRPHLPDRQPAALDGAVPLRRRARAQRPHRRAQDRRGRPARRSRRRRRDAGPVPPAAFNYDAWLGSTPVVPYAVDRVHPQHGYGRPGWLRCEQFGAGMITGWGAHHIDSAHWGMDTEYTGPVEIWGTAEFPTQGLWNVHGAVPHRGALRQRRAHDRQRRLPERHQVHRHQGLDLRLARQRDGHGERSGREAEGRARRCRRATRRSSPR